MDRKEIVKVLSEHLCIKSKYLGAPSFAYEVGSFTVTREGKILNKAGDEVELEDILSPEETTTVEISFPMEGHDGKSIKNLLNMIYSREFLIKKAFGLEEDIVDEEFIKTMNEEDFETFEEFFDLPGKENCKYISFNREKITFNFVTEDIEASMKFFELLIDKSKELLYVSKKSINTDNEKYAFRTWLMRLGMIGDEYKNARKVLLKNLSGNGAFRKPGEQHEA
ncbi:virulence-related protein [Tissierella sp.]|uniref:virulence-related protein n=1 Tax=Tissierella sp. TaxID=41274 RepID=UPI003020CF94